MTSYNHTVGQEQDCKGNLHLLDPKGTEMQKQRLRMACRKELEWGKRPDLSSACCASLQSSKKADDKRVESFPSLPAGAGADVSSHHPAKPIARLRWPLLWSSGAGWRRWRQDSCIPKQGDTFQFKGQKSTEGATWSHPQQPLLQPELLPAIVLFYSHI